MHKILIVLDSLWVGGTERSIAEILPHLLSAGITPVIVCLRRRFEEGVEKEVLERGFDVRFLTNQRTLAKVIQLRKIIRSQRPELVHSSLYQANLITRLSAVGLGVPVLCSLVNTPYETVRYQDPSISPIRLKITQQIDAITSRRLTTHFHAVSNFAKLSAVKRLGIPAERITVVERGRDAVRLGEPSVHRREKARKELGICPQDLVLVNVGRQEFQKGQRHLFEALAQLLPSFPRLILLIAGREGSQTRDLRGLCDKLRLKTAVRLLGHRENIPEILAAANLFVFPSLFEGLPGAIIEAMALGLPIVASDIPTNREVVENDENAILVNAGSSAALAKGIEVLLQDESKQKRFGRRSREIFEQRFTLNRVAPQMIELYQKVANDSRK